MNTTFRQWTLILLPLVSVVALCSRVNADYVFATSFGSLGSGIGQFYQPSDLAFAPSGNILVADSGNSRIEEFSKTGTYLGQFGSHGTGVGQFQHPIALAVDRSGSIFVVDDVSDCVKKFSSDGTYLMQFDVWGMAIAVDGSGNLLVGHFPDGIMKFSNTGTYITEFTDATDRMYEPSGLAVDQSNNMFVSGKFQGVNGFNSTGTFLMQYGTDYANAVAVDQLGNVFVASPSHVQEFSSTGSLITQFGSYGSGDGQFKEPSGLAIDGLGNVYIADYMNNRVVVFSPVPVPEPSSLVLLVISAISFLAVSYRRRKRANSSHVPCPVHHALIFPTLSIISAPPALLRSTAGMTGG